MDPRAQYPHRKNAPLFECLQKRATSQPVGERTAYDIDEYEVHTHPDLCDFLWSLNPYLKGAAYGYPILSEPGGVIFGVATGTSFLALRLPEPERGKAVLAGAQAAPDLGQDWVFFPAWRTDAVALKEWCRKAHAGSLSKEG